MIFNVIGIMAYENFTISYIICIYRDCATRFFPSGFERYSWRYLILQILVRVHLLAFNSVPDRTSRLLVHQRMNANGFLLPYD
jgi:hypothetical protein